MWYTKIHADKALIHIKILLKEELHLVTYKMVRDKREVFLW